MFDKIWQNFQSEVFPQKAAATTQKKSLFSLNHNRTKARLFSTVDGSIMNLYFCYDKKYNVAKLWRFRTQYIRYYMHKHNGDDDDDDGNDDDEDDALVRFSMGYWYELNLYVTYLHFFSHTTCGISFEILRIGASNVRTIYRGDTFGFISYIELIVLANILDFREGEVHNKMYTVWNG